MKNASSLLVTLHPKDGSAPLRFMTGHAFDVLRTDISGREVYGLFHGGEEYLFFPLRFCALSHMVLHMDFPLGYEDALSGPCLDGARVTFSSPRGWPRFQDIGDEYQSCTGILQRDEAGRLTILLDAVDPDTGPAPEEAKGAARTASVCEPSAAQNAQTVAGDEDSEPCGCGHRHGPSAADLASALRVTAAELNVLLGMASEAGLVVHMTLEREPAPDGGVRLVLGRILQPL